MRAHRRHHRVSARLGRSILRILLGAARRPAPRACGPIVGIAAHAPDPASAAGPAHPGPCAGVRAHRGSFTGRSARRYARARSSLAVSNRRYRDLVSRCGVSRVRDGRWSLDPRISACSRRSVEPRSAHLGVSRRSGEPRCTHLGVFETVGGASLRASRRFETAGGGLDAPSWPCFSRIRRLEAPIRALGGCWSRPRRARSRRRSCLRPGRWRCRASREAAPARST